ncbi:MAG: cytochrome c-type biogenesis protein CcmH [Candidatus Hydrothermarchaeota archaeon]
MLRNIIPIFFLIVPALALTVEDISKDVYCPCGCNMLLANCECETKAYLVGEIQDMISKGMTREEIIKTLQETYGRQILATPPKKGFNLALWTYPLIGLIVGASIIYVLSKRRESVTWYTDPDEVLEMSEEDFIKLESEKLEKKSLHEKYEKLFEKEYEKFKVIRKKNN